MLGRSHSVNIKTMAMKIVTRFEMPTPQRNQDRFVCPSQNSSLRKTTMHNLPATVAMREKRTPNQPYMAADLAELTSLFNPIVAIPSTSK